MDGTHLVISNSNELLRVAANHIIYIKSDGNYSHILQTGGEMILIKGVMPKDFDEKIFAVNVGDVSDPIKTDNGYYVIKVQEKKAKRDFTFEQVAPDMGQYLSAVKMQEEMNSYLNTLKDKSKIKVMVKFDEPVKDAKTEATKTEAK